MTTPATDVQVAPSAFAGSRILTWRWPWLYEALFRLSPTSQRVRASEIAEVLARIDEVGHPGQVVVEVGCGPGTYTRLLASRFAHVTALDAASEIVAYTIARTARDGHRNVAGAYGRLPNDLHAVSGADGVVAVGVLDFADDLVEWMRALRGYVAPGGWVVFTVPASHTAPRVAGIVEGFLSGRAFTRDANAVRAAVASAGLRCRRVAAVEHRGRCYTLVVSAVRP